jgi:hypothetical protein
MLAHIGAVSFLFLLILHLCSKALSITWFEYRGASVKMVHKCVDLLAKIIKSIGIIDQIATQGRILVFFREGSTYRSSQQLNQKLELQVSSECAASPIAYFAVGFHGSDVKLQNILLIQWDYDEERLVLSFTGSDVRQSPHRFF